jgi:hypothetical protein
MHPGKWRMEKEKEKEKEKGGEGTGRLSQWSNRE